MARKTVQEKIANVKVNPHFDASYKDTAEVLQLGNLFDIFSIAFQYGYLQGSKATKEEMRVKV